jgi:hypothetical protein
MWDFFVHLLSHSNRLTVLGRDGRVREKHVSTLSTVDSCFGRWQTRKYTGDSTDGKNYLN